MFIHVIDFSIIFHKITEMYISHETLGVVFLGKTHYLKFSRIQNTDNTDLIKQSNVYVQE